MFLDGHAESHTLQELGYVVTPTTYTYTNPTTRQDHHDHHQRGLAAST